VSGGKTVPQVKKCKHSECNDSFGRKWKEGHKTHNGKNCVKNLLKTGKGGTKVRRGKEFDLEGLKLAARKVAKQASPNQTLKVWHFKTRERYQNSIRSKKFKQQRASCRHKRRGEHRKVRYG